MSVSFDWIDQNQISSKQMNQSYQYEFGNFLFTHFDCELSYILMMAFHTFWFWPWKELWQGAHQMNLDWTLSLTFPSNIIARQAASIVMVPATLVQRIGSSKTTTWRWWASVEVLVSIVSSSPEVCRRRQPRDREWHVPGRICTKLKSGWTSLQ